MPVFVPPFERQSDRESVSRDTAPLVRTVSVQRRCMNERQAFVRASGRRQGTLCCVHDDDGSAPWGNFPGAWRPGADLNPAMVSMHGERLTAFGIRV